MLDDPERLLTAQGCALYSLYAFRLRNLNGACMRQRHFIFILCLLPGPVAAEWMDWSAELELAVGSDDNVNLAIDNYAEDDEHLALKARIGRAYQFDAGAHSNTRLRLNADAARKFYNDWDDLTRTRLGFGAELKHKLGLGLRAARLSAGFSAHYEDVRDADRESWRGDVHLGVDKRLGARLDLGFKLFYRARAGEDWTPSDPMVDSNVYDTDHLGATLALRYLLQPRLRLSAAASYLDGEFDSDCADYLAPGGGSVYRDRAGPGAPPLWQQFDLKAVAVDQVFGCRWRADGDGYQLRAALGWLIDRRSSLRFTVGYQEIQMDYGQDYDSTTLGLSYRYAL